MRFLVLAALVCAASAWKVRTPGTSEAADWETYKAEHGKTYLTRSADHYRQSLYLAEVEAVNQWNQEYDQGMHSYFKGINQFSDLTRDEFVAQQKLKVPADIEARRAAGHHNVPQSTAPAAIDWREEGAVQHVKNQGQCGSCWAFATVAALEGRTAIKSGTLPDISEQQFVSCSPEKYDTFGCNGGWYDGAWKYAHDQGTHGIDTQSSYPYTARDDACDTAKTSDDLDVAATCEGPGYTEKTEASVMEEVGNNGPLAIAINCAPWGSYSGGVFDDPSCTAGAMHAVTIVGYSDSEKYWIVKNSWGANWGDAGYILLRKDSSIQYGMCGLAQYAYYPMV